MKVVIGELKTLNFNGREVLYKEYPKSVLVIGYYGERSEVKSLMEKEFKKPVRFLGELLALTG